MYDYHIAVSIKTLARVCVYVCVRASVAWAHCVCVRAKIKYRVHKVKYERTFITSLALELRVSRWRSSGGRGRSMKEACTIIK